jgi:ribosomal protein S12 methylthiotransferase accessory factor
VPDSWDDFTDLLHGATFMAKAQSASAFEFLTQTKAIIRLSEIQNAQPMDTALQPTLNKLKQKSLDAYAVDLSTDEAIRSGMRVVRVIIPELMPLSFRYRARFLGTPRLYAAALAMGYSSYSEDELNSWPQPFA